MDGTLTATFGVKKMPARNREFFREIQRAGIRNLELCYQCSACSNGCPLAFAMDYYPNQVIYLTRLGLKEDVLHSRTIWLCTSCETCVTRCPNQIDLVHLMDVLRSKVLQGKAAGSEFRIQAFHRTFMSEVKKRGRINELVLLMLYKLRTARLLTFKNLREEAALGFMMLKKRKVKLFLPAMDDTQDIKRIFQRNLSRQKAGERVNQ